MLAGGRFSRAYLADAEVRAAVGFPLSRSPHQDGSSSSVTQLNKQDRTVETGICLDGSSTVCSGRVPKTVSRDSTLNEAKLAATYVADFELRCSKLAAHGTTDAGSTPATFWPQF